MPREERLEQPACGYCGALTRRKFLTGKGAGKGTRMQHTRWRVCGNGHQLYMKRG